MLRALLALFLLGTLAEAGAFLAVCLCAHRNFPARPSDALVVLGARVRPDGSPTDALRYRLDSAKEAYDAGISKTIVVCGARGADEPRTEAEAMKEYLMRIGVPGADIVLEDQSFNTVANLKNASAIMEARGLDTCAIVTSDYHMTRALFIARRLGLNACGYKAPSVKRPGSFFPSRLRETLSWQYYALIWRP